MQPGSRLRAVIFDWAGTTVDFGSRAPVAAFVRTFEQSDIRITEAEARMPMGLPKRAHIEALANMPRIAAEWRSVHDRPFAESDLDALYTTFEPITASVVLEHSDVILGVVELLHRLRENRIAVGSTTGYSREVMRSLIPVAAASGFGPDCVVCPDDQRPGRPDAERSSGRVQAVLRHWPA
jgi:phosphonoacetaldehyde hydrolase